MTTSKFGIRKRGTEIGRAIKAATTVAPAAVTLIKTGGSKPARVPGLEELDLTVGEENRSTKEVISSFYRAVEQC